MRALPLKQNMWKLFSQDYHFPNEPPKQKSSLFYIFLKQNVEVNYKKYHDKRECKQVAIKKVTRHKIINSTRFEEGTGGLITSICLREESACGRALCGALPQRYF